MVSDHSRIGLRVLEEVLTFFRGSDVFRDTAATRHLPDQPGFTGDFTEKKGRREDALKQLLASVPEESKEIAASDKAYLNSCVRDFTGHASVRPANDNNWSVKGSTYRCFVLLELRVTDALLL